MLEHDTMLYYLWYKYSWGRSIQEMGVGDNVVIGRSIYWVVVIDGSLYS